ncbi:hypothetical protein ARMGADRAFT_1033783 [Armillaria gallica]|uniref:Uncharacterized protein n=1 Tax=Armillaria gallica TaxID=47427 RepID=A0A2H3DBL2_ARMGA|nr:hypothetical protein ARMGADRAFT_1033783 [Armillaria gallica]
MPEWLSKEKKAIQDWFYATKRTLLQKGLNSRQVKAEASDKAEAALRDLSALKHSWTLLKAYIKFWYTPCLEFCSTILQMTKDTEAACSVKLTSSKIMKLCHMLGSQLLQLEPNLVKDAILELSCKSREDVALNKMEMQAPVNVSTLMPEQIHVAVVKLPKIVKLMLLNQTVLQSRFEGFVLIGGPDPSLPGGAIHSLIQYLEERFHAYLLHESVGYFTDKQNSTGKTLGFMGNLDDFIAMLNSSEDALVGGTSSVPKNIVQTDSHDEEMVGVMKGMDSLDFSCMRTSTNEGSFNSTLRTDFLGSTAVDNLSELEVNTLSVYDKIVKPTGVTATIDDLLSGISLFGPSPPRVTSPARSTSSINLTKPIRPMMSLNNPSPSTKDDSMTLMDTDIHDSGTISATAPNVEKAEPQSLKVEAVLNESSRPSVMPLGDNEINCQI